MRKNERLGPPGITEWKKLYYKNPADKNAWDLTHRPNFLNTPNSPGSALRERWNIAYFVEAALALRDSEVMNHIIDAIPHDPHIARILDRYPIHLRILALSNQPSKKGSK